MGTRGDADTPTPEGRMNIMDEHKRNYAPMSVTLSVAAMIVSVLALLFSCGAGWYAWTVWDALHAAMPQ